MTSLVDRYGPWALVTGASAGLGAEFARQLAAHGLNLVLVARRKERLYDLGYALQEAHGVETVAVGLDLSREDFWPTLARATEGLEVNLLVNNAGFSLTGALTELPLERQIEMLHLNCRAPLILSHAYGGLMRERGRGGIVFMSSIVGFVPTPNWTNYAGTKAYNLFLGEGMAAEMRRHGVDVLVVAPGHTRTEFHENAGIGPLLPMEPAAVVRETLNNLGQTHLLIPGSANRLLVFLPRFLPRRLNARVSGLIVKGLQGLVP